MNDKEIRSELEKEDDKKNVKDRCEEESGKKRIVSISPKSSSSCPPTKCVTRRASLSDIIKSTFTPKRITSRRSSLSLNKQTSLNDLKPISYKIQKPLLIYKKSEDMGAIIEDDGFRLEICEISGNTRESNLNDKKESTVCKKRIIPTPISVLFSDSKGIDETLVIEERISTDVEENETLTSGKWVHDVNEKKHSNIENKVNIPDVHVMKIDSSVSNVFDETEYYYGEAVIEENESTTTKVSVSPSVIRTSEKRQTIPYTPEFLETSKPDETVESRNDVCKLYTEESVNVESSNCNDMTQSMKSPKRYTSGSTVLNEFDSVLGKTPLSYKTLCSTGVGELSKTPKLYSASSFDGINELVDSPKDVRVVGRVESEEPEELKIGTISTRGEENLDVFFRTPSSKNLMITSLSNSAVIVKKNDSVELVHSTEMDLNTTPADDVKFETLFKTPVSSGFTEYITDSDYAKEDKVANPYNENISNKVSLQGEEYEEVQELSAEKTFDELTGQTSQIQTPVSKVYMRKSLNFTTIQQSPFSAADVLSDLPKTDIQEWVDKLEAAEPPIDYEHEDGLGESLSPKNEEKNEITLRDSMSQQLGESLDPSLISLGVYLQKTNDNITACSVGICNDNYISEADVKVSVDSCAAETTDVSCSIDTLTPVQGEISGINLLDQTAESAFSEALIISDTESMNDKLEDDLKNANENKFSKSLLEKTYNEDKEEETNELLQPLIVSDSESLDKSEEKGNNLKRTRLQNMLEFKNFDENKICLNQRSKTPNFLKGRSKMLRRSIGTEEDLKVTIDFALEASKAKQTSLCIIKEDKDTQEKTEKYGNDLSEKKEKEVNETVVEPNACRYSEEVEVGNHISEIATSLDKLQKNVNKLGKNPMQIMLEFKNFDENKICLNQRSKTPNFLKGRSKMLRRSIGTEEDLKVTIDFALEASKAKQTSLCIVKENKDTQEKTEEYENDLSEKEEKEVDEIIVEPNTCRNSEKAEDGGHINEVTTSLARNENINMKEIEESTNLIIKNEFLHNDLLEDLVRINENGINNKLEQNSSSTVLTGETVSTSINKNCRKPLILDETIVKQIFSHNEDSNLETIKNKAHLVETDAINKNVPKDNILELEDSKEEREKSDNTSLSRDSLNNKSIEETISCNMNLEKDLLFTSTTMELLKNTSGTSSFKEKISKSEKLITIEGATDVTIKTNEDLDKQIGNKKLAIRRCRTRSELSQSNIQNEDKPTYRGRLRNRATPLKEVLNETKIAENIDVSQMSAIPKKNQEGEVILEEQLSPKMKEEDSKKASRRIHVKRKLAHELKDKTVETEAFNLDKDIFSTHDLKHAENEMKSENGVHRGMDKVHKLATFQDVEIEEMSKEKTIEIESKVTAEKRICLKEARSTRNRRGRKRTADKSEMRIGSQDLKSIEVIGTIGKDEDEANIDENPIRKRRGVRRIQENGEEISANKRNVGRKRQDEYLKGVSGQTDTTKYNSKIILKEESEGNKEDLTKDASKQCQILKSEDEVIKSREDECTEDKQKVGTELMKQQEMKPRDRKRKESHTDSENNTHNDELVCKRRRRKLDVHLEEELQTSQRGGSRRLLKTSANDVDQHTSSIISENDTSHHRRGRNIPVRRAAIAYHNYNEGSDTEISVVQGSRAEVFGATVMATASAAKPASSVVEVGSESKETSDNAVIVSAATPITTARGRTRKPTAKIRQFLEEERAKTMTPKKKDATSMGELVDTSTPLHMPARRGRKPSVKETTNMEIKEVKKITRRGRGHLEISNEEFLNSKGQITTSASSDLITQKHRNMCGIDMPTPTRTAGKRNAAAAAKVRIEEDALAAAASAPEPPKRSRSKRSAVKRPITADPDEHGSEKEEEKLVISTRRRKRVQNTSEETKKDLQKIASMSTINVDTASIDKHENNEIMIDTEEKLMIERPPTQNPRPVARDTLTITSTRNRKVKTATNDDVDCDLSTVEFKTKRGGGVRNRKGVHFKPTNEDLTLATTTCTPVDIEGELSLSTSTEPVKRVTRSRRK